MAHIPSLRSVRLWPWTAGFVAVVAAAGCTDETIVFRDREPFNPPSDQVNGFLGYFDVGTRQTTCGNCHAGFQAKWKETRHAGAFKTLTDLPAGTAKDYCYACHTVSANGNATTGDAGWVATKDSTYQDVQCEACHGPGLEHVENVGQGKLVRPLAKLSQSGDANCTDCHTGTHTPFAEEWRESGHAGIITTAASRAECRSCHDGRGTLAAWGVESNYLERDDPSAYQPVSCPVCHNPHGSPNSHQLRFGITSPDPEQNLCMKCHIRRVEPAGGSAYGTRPHAPQGAVLLGTAGYRPAGFEYDTARIFGTHATDRNPKLCAGCHVGRFTVTDPASGNFVFQATGHLFQPIPCLDPQGKPTGDDSCAFTAAARSWRTCTVSGCHGSAEAAASAFAVARGRMKALADVLWSDTDQDQTIDATGDAGYLPMVKAARPGEFAPDAVITAAEGAEFNSRLCGEGLYANGDKSKGVHNVFLCEALLRANISEMKALYGLPSPPASAQAILDGPLGGPNASAVRVSRTSIWR